MGSVTIIFLIPIMIIIMLFGTAVGAIKGDNVTKVELPYNPSEGIVWEYDGVDDPLFDLVETEIDCDKQVFTFEGTAVFDGIFEEDREPVDSDMVMDVVFTNENGEELLYYAAVNHDYLSLNRKIEFWSPDEYVIAEYTPKAENYIEEAEWIVWGNSKYFYGETESDGEKTFSFLYLPHKSDISKNRYTEKFYYMIEKTDDTEEIYYERLIVEFEAEIGKYKINEEEREFYHEEDKTLYYGDGWVKYNPALLED